MFMLSMKGVPCINFFTLWLLSKATMSSRLRQQPNTLNTKENMVRMAESVCEKIMVSFSGKLVLQLASSIVKSVCLVYALLTGDCN